MQDFKRTKKGKFNWNWAAQAKAKIQNDHQCHRTCCYRPLPWHPDQTSGSGDRGGQSAGFGRIEWGEAHLAYWRWKKLVMVGTMICCYCLLGDLKEDYQWLMLLQLLVFLLQCLVWSLSCYHFYCCKSLDLSPCLGWLILLVLCLLVLISAFKGIPISYAC